MEAVENSLDPDHVQVLHCPRCSFLSFQYTRFVEHVISHGEAIEVALYQCLYCPLISTHIGLLTEHTSLKHAQLETNVRRLSTTLLNPDSNPRPSNSSSPDNGENTDGSLNGFRTHCFLCGFQSPGGVKGLSDHFQVFHNLFNVTSSTFQTRNFEALRSSGNDCQTNQLTNGVVNGYDHNEKVLTNHHEPDTTRMEDGTVVVQPADAPLDPSEECLTVSDWQTDEELKDMKNDNVKMVAMVEQVNNTSTRRTSIDLLCASLGSRKRKMGLSHYRRCKAPSSPQRVPPIHKPQLTTVQDSLNVTSMPAMWSPLMMSSSGGSPAMMRVPLGTRSVQRVVSGGNMSAALHNKMTMRRKRGRPPKLSVRVHTEDEIMARLRPHLKPAGEATSEGTPSWEWLLLAPNQPYATRVRQRLLVEAYDTDGVQFLRNLLRGYFSLSQLTQYAWDANQRRGRPRSSGLEMDSEASCMLGLKSLRDEPFVRASLDLIRALFNQAFPDNLPVFINRMLTRLREQSVGDMTGSAIENNNQEDSGGWDRWDAEKALSPYITSSNNEDDDCVVICSDTPEVQTVSRSLLLQCYDADPLRYLRNLIRLGIPHEELRQSTWKGMNTGRPRLDDSPTAGPADDQMKRSLKDDCRVRAYLQHVQAVCGRSLPENIGPHIHQILSSIRNKGPTAYASGGLYQQQLYQQQQHSLLGKEGSECGVDLTLDGQNSWSA